MANEPVPLRQYTEREVRLILKSAVELQQGVAGRTGATSEGMSLAELEQVAIEAGLDPSFVRQAALRLDAPHSSEEPNAFLGSPTHIVVERVVDVVIDEAGFDQFLDVVRAATHEVGEVSSIGRQFGWKGRMDGAKTEVSVSAGDRRTTVRVRVELDEVAVGHFMLKGVLFGVGGGVVGAAVASTLLGPLSVVIGAGALASGYLWSRRGLRGETARFYERANDLADAVATRAAGMGRGIAAPDVRRLPPLHGIQSQS